MDREKNGLNDEESTLLELFKRRFPEHSVTTAEERLLLEVQKGEVRSRGGKVGPGDVLRVRDECGKIASGGER